MIRQFIRTFLDFVQFEKQVKISTQSNSIDISQTSSSKIRRTYRVVKAIKQFQKENESICAWCGTSASVEIHHIIPIWMDANLAHDQDNLFPLCRRCHFVLGHAGSFRDRYIENVKKICELKNLIDRRVS